MLRSIKMQKHKIEASLAQRKCKSINKNYNIIMYHSTNEIQVTNFFANFFSIHVQFVYHIIQSMQMVDKWC